MRVEDRPDRQVSLPNDESPVPDLEGLRSFVARDPRLDAIRSAGEGVEAYLVGGSVRDLLLGRTPSDLDVAVEGEPSSIVGRLDPEAIEHPRFRTACLDLDGGRVDLAATRTESYSYPGALPDVEPATIEEDLARRDFSVNAIAVPLSEPGEIVDPFDGLEALRQRRLSILGSNSFRDDPLRALRGARYAARFGFQPDEEMTRALKNVDLGSVSDDRLNDELEKLARERQPEAALDTARRWGLLDVSGDLVELVGRARCLLAEEPWVDFASLPDVVSTALGSEDSIREMPEEPPKRKIDQHELLKGTRPGLIVLARAAGRSWLDWWPEVGMKASLEIDGDDLIEAGVEPGPRVGLGLRAALADLLETGSTDRNRQLETALVAAEKT